MWSHMQLKAAMFHTKLEKTNSVQMFHWFKIMSSLAAICNVTGRSILFMWRKVHFISCVLEIPTIESWANKWDYEKILFAGLESGFFKGCGMGLWLVLVSPCFRENVVATCKIGSFLCSLDNWLQKNVIVLCFGNQISKWRSFEIRPIFDLLFTFFSHQGKVTKIPSAHISLTNIHVFCSPYWLFCFTNFEKNTNLSDMVSLWYESWCLILFRAILEQSINNKMVSKI